MYIHITYAPIEDCKSEYQTYGEICIKCNKCGRFDGKEDEEELNED